jgi:hypothetical protein
VLALPFDLVRHDLLVDLEPLEPQRIQSIVDDLFLPLVSAHRSACPCLGPVGSRPPEGEA